MKHIINWLIYSTLCILMVACKSNSSKQDFSTSALKTESQNSKNLKYNILMIAVDDLNDWTGFMGGHPQTLTPNMDKLAKESMVFDLAYCAASVCNPSRAAIMSGYKPSTTGIFQNGDKVFDVPLINNSLMLPQYLSKYGYHTLSRGKIYHTPATGKHTWDEWSPVSGNYGATQSKKGLLDNGIPRGEMSDNMDWAPTTGKTEETPDYLNAQWAAEQLQEGFDKPFFMAVGIFRPHLEWKVPKEFYDKFPVENMILPEVLESDLDDTRENFSPTKEYTAIEKYSKQKEAVQAYLASINYADYCVGVILDALAKSKYADNTIVVLWGDHGWHLGEKLRYKKFTLWEEACRVPFIFKVPGMIKPESRSNRPINLLDLYPTLLELTGLPENQKNEGNSFVPLLINPELKWDRASLTQMGEGRNTIRTEKYRYIKYEDGSEELYDHEVDPLEWHNEINNPVYKNVRTDLRNKLSELTRKNNS
ncbi:sulfatase [Leeuwenhoekiella parthenopeia]|uniref:Sulfatase n=1 Tax=Leeuwenhoekiella parthenopeia TaxID=2890320 RepID=A0ABS8GNN5_9FLAO|nr:sulfatase [Leeuwenhoekiella parthenopeia]MCC4211278.1 sulfatase [Leeuwenhoekiella parthenopeia]